MKEPISKRTILEKIKLHTVSLVIICFAILTGCGDDLTSSVTSKQNQVIGSDSILGDNLFNYEFTLRPGKTVFLDSTNISQTRISGYSISNCNIEFQDLFISSSSIDRSLDCSWKTYNGFMLKDLSIKNICRQTKIIEVKLTGISSK